MKAVVIMSGGIDSSTLLYKVKRDYDTIFGITFDYGQSHRIELDAAKNIAKTAGIHEHLIYRLPTLLGSALTDGHMIIPKEDYSIETQKITVVPNRNMVFLSFAANLAIAKRADAIFYGAHASDYAVYPDCRREFVDAAEVAINTGNYDSVCIHAPFLDMKKWEIVKLGQELGVPFQLTWSCYDPQWVYGEAVHCGISGTCRERKLAFEEAEIYDPTAYWK